MLQCDRIRKMVNKFFTKSSDTNVFFHGYLVNINQYGS